jgi:tetratricopeptide (TPR) repeat protein
VKGRLRTAACALVLVSLGACGDSGPPPDPTQIIVTRNNGLLALQQDRLDDAEARFNELIEMTPREGLGYAYLGLVELRRGNADSAEKHIRDGLRRDDRDPEVHRMLAAALAEQGKADGARAALTEALALDPGNLRSLWALAELDQASDDRASRVTTLSTLAATAPANVAARLAWARALVAVNAADSATAALEGLRQQLPALPRRIAQAFDSSLVLLQGGDAAGAAPLLDDFSAYFTASGPYQASYDELRGPDPEIVGIPTFTFSFKFSLAVQEQEAVLAALRFADGTAIAGLEDHPLAGTASAFVTTDVDGDGDEDLLTAATDGSGWALHRVDLGLFVDASATSGLGPGVATESMQAADYDNDGYLDLVQVGPGALRLSRNLGDSSFEDVTDAAGLPSDQGGTHALWADLDHDGDLDLLVSGQGTRVYRNDGDGTFTEVTETWGLDVSARTRDAVYADLDDDGDLDLLLAVDGGAPLLFTNDRGGRFSEIGQEAGLGQARAQSLGIADVDGDGALDLVTGETTATRLWINQGRGSFVRADWTGPGAEFIRILDFDNDGTFDLLLGGRGGLGLFRGDGTGAFEDFTERLPGAGAAYRSASIIDYNEDGDLDLLLSVAEGGFRLLRNDGGNANHYLQIELEGLAAGSGKNNRDGIGSRVEVTAGDLYQVQVVTDPSIHIGLGSRRKADVIRIEWTNGVWQDIYFPGTDQDLEEQILKGSCPMLFTWNGERFEFQKDVMWKSALGMPTGIQGNQGTRSYGPPESSREFIRISGDQLVERDGRYELRITEELWETIYMDEVKLLAVDHPSGLDVFVDERFVPSNVPVAFEPHTVRTKIPPRSAVDDRGRDVLGALSERDHVYASGILRGPLQGLTEPHALTLDLGPEVAGADHARLFLTGWVFPTDASLNVAMAQSDVYAIEAPVLEVPDGRGGWVVALDDVSFPSGKDKTLILDISGLVPESDPRVRIRTNMQIYWDWVFASLGRSEEFLETTPLELAGADLRYRGFSGTFRKGGRYGPHWFDYDSVTTDAKWRDLIGLYTRYGDVSELLTQADDRYVIMNAGDEIAIEFDAASAPELPEGWTRDFIIYTEGWVKDGDLNTETGSTVGPLPFHGMTRYPYGADEAYPSDSVRQSYLREYNTRRVGPDER